MSTETDLSRAIQDALGKLGAMVERIQSGKVRVRGGYMHLASEGTPDLFVAFRGATGFLEVKTREGERRTAQAEWHERAHKHGVRVAVVRSVEEALRTVMSWRKEAA
jgi:hypothetical protein